MARMATGARTPLCDEQEMVWSHCGTRALDGMDKAFKNPSSIQSVDALELFLSQKCFAGGLGLSTAQRIQVHQFADYRTQLCHSDVTRVKVRLCMLLWHRLNKTFEFTFTKLPEVSVLHINFNTLQTPVTQFLLSG